MSDLHEELYNQLAKRGLPMPNIFPFDLLKDVTVETMVRFITLHHFARLALNNYLITNILLLFRGDIYFITF